MLPVKKGSREWLCHRTSRSAGSAGVLNILGQSPWASPHRCFDVGDLACRAPALSPDIAQWACAAIHRIARRPFDRGDALDGRRMRNLAGFGLVVATAGRIGADD